MVRPKIYHTEAQTKAARAEQKRLKRQNQTNEQKQAEAERKATKSAAEKQQKEARALKRLAQSDEDWVISLISEIFSDVPIISEKQNVRRTTNTKAAKL